MYMRCIVTFKQIYKLVNFFYELCPFRPTVPKEKKVKHYMSKTARQIVSTYFFKFFK